MSDSFSGTFVKLDEGNVSWKIKNKIGKISLSRYDQGTRSINLSSQEHDIVRAQFGSFSALGSMADIEKKFKNTKKSTQDEVSTIIKNKMADEISDLKGTTKVISHDFNLTDLKCVKKGIINKSLDCSAKYKSKITAEITIDLEANKNPEVNTHSRGVQKDLIPDNEQKSEESMTLSK